MKSYDLVISRFDGIEEIEKTIFTGSFDDCMELRALECCDGAFIDYFGNEWYSEIVEVMKDGKK